MAGLKVVAVKTHEDGNLDLEDLKAKAEEHKDKLAAIMVCLQRSLRCPNPIIFLYRSHIHRLSGCLRLVYRMYSFILSRLAITC